MTNAASKEKRSKNNHERPQLKKIRPDVDSDDDFELPISTFKQKTSRKRIREEDNDHNDFVEPVPNKKYYKVGGKGQTQAKQPEKRKRQKEPDPSRTEARAFFEYNNESILLRDANLPRTRKLLRNFQTHKSPVLKVWGSKPVVTVADKRKLEKAEKIKKHEEPEGGDSILDLFRNQWAENARITHASVATAMTEQRDAADEERMEKQNKIEYVGPVAFLTGSCGKNPVIHYTSSALIDQLEEHVSTKGPLTDNEKENDSEHDQDKSAKGPVTDNENDNDCEHEQDHSAEDYTIPPVDLSKCYIKGSTFPTVDRDEPCSMSDDMPELETSELNLVMGVGTQTQKILDYYSTPVQLSPTVFYSPEQERQREASRINKWNLLKRMTSNMKKYNSIVLEMNKLVSDAKTKCFWDPEILQACKQWEDTLRTSTFCMPASDTMPNTGSRENAEYQESQLNDEQNIRDITGDKVTEDSADRNAKKADNEHMEDTYCRENADFEEVQPNNGENSRDNLRGKQTEGVQEADDLISDTCIARFQTAEPGVYVYNQSPVQEDGSAVMETVSSAESTQKIQEPLADHGLKDDNNCETEAEAVDLAASTQNQQHENDSSNDVMVYPDVTAEELYSVETLLSLTPHPDKEHPQRVHKEKNPPPVWKKDSNQIEKHPPEKGKAGQKVHGGRKKVVPKGLNEIVFKSIESAKVRNEKRYSDLGEAFCSPYCNRVVNVKEALLDRELSVVRYTFATLAVTESVFYRSKTGVQAFKVVFESFFPNQYVAASGIDTFVDVLNQEEKRRDKISSPYRLFLHSTMLPSTMYGNSYSDQKRLKVFSSNLDDMLKKYSVKKLELVDLLFIPILQGDHFYCMCFHMKTGQVEILDNSAAEQDFDDKYKGLPNTLKSMATAAINGLEKSAIVRKEMDWRTLNNGVDCGIFTMRHMETYKGKTPGRVGWSKKLMKASDNGRKSIC